MLKKAVLSMLALMLLLTLSVISSPLEAGVQAMSTKAESSMVYVLVNSTVYAAIKSSLNQYAADVANLGFSVNIIETNQLSDKTPKGIRSFLNEALSKGLVGCLLVGDIPEAYYQASETCYFPIDLYYMDLDGVWTDSNNDTRFDGHLGDISPEIWIGRLKTSNIAGGEIPLLKKYFDKNHRYRNGSINLPWWRALIYIDDSGTIPLNTRFTRAENEIKSSLSRIYSDITFVRERATTNAADYKNRLNDPLGYQWAYLMCHGTYNNHTFMVPPKETDGSWYSWDGTVHASDYRSINPRVFFYHFVVCSAARYSEQDYLAGSAVFGTSYGLLSIGSTEDISTLPVSGFYESLSQGKCIGAAFHEWFVALSQKYDYPQRRFYGLTIIGDPTLQLQRELHDVAVTKITASLMKAAGEKYLSVMVTVENQGNFTETLNVTTYCDLVSFNTTNINLATGAKTTITCIFMQPQFILGYHTIKARVTTVLGEVDRDDNSLSTTFKGLIINSPVLVQKPLLSILIDIFTAISVFVTFGMAAIAFLKILMSERLPSLSFISKKLRRLTFSHRT
jgi:hypothetical protein